MYGLSVKILCTICNWWFALFAQVSEKPQSFFMYLFVLNCFLCFCLVVILMQQFLLIQRLISLVGDK